jgi:ribonuclease P protein component
MVAAKTVKTAVRRHQLKRWVRELFRTQLQHTLAGMDLVVLFRADPPEHGHRELETEIGELVVRALTTRAQAGGRARAQGSRGGRAPGQRPAPQPR